MCEAGHGERRHRVRQLLPEVGQLVVVHAHLGQPGRGAAVGVPDELEQQFGAEQLHGVGHRDPELPEPPERGELRPRPLLGDEVTAERRAGRHRPVLARAPHPAALEVAGVAVEHPVLAGPVALRRQQTRAAGRYRALDQVDVGLLAGLEHAELGVDRAELGHHPLRSRGGSVLGLQPGRVRTAVRRVLGPFGGAGGVLALQFEGGQGRTPSARCRDVVVEPAAALAAPAGRNDQVVTVVRVLLLQRGVPSGDRVEVGCGARALVERARAAARVTVVTSPPPLLGISRCAGRRRSGRRPGWRGSPRVRNWFSRGRARRRSRNGCVAWPGARLTAA